MINDRVLVYCETCKKMVPKTKASYIKENGHVKRCLICKWKNKHKDKLYVSGFTNNEIDIFLSFFLFKESIYLNDIADKLNRTIDEMVYLFKQLKISNRKCIIKITCEYCQKPYEVNIERYSTAKYHYCSFECYKNDKTNKMNKGIDSQFYNRVTDNCKNCGTLIKIIPSRNKKNRYGDSNHFCCKECYYSYRAKYYIGEKSPNYQKPMSEEARIKSGISHAKIKKEQTILDTKIQKIGNRLLDNLHVNYEREYSVKFYSIDNYIDENNLGIEIMGDYWHANPKIYNTNVGKCINQIQIKDIIRDKKKRTFLKNKNIFLLYLWESDLKSDEDLCQALIKYYIEKQGVIENYNSFNWELYKGSLRLKEEISYPYFELDKKEYQKIMA
jgi:G:T-mismatch repair DNA endonuclease (very short patch repair protein)